MINDNSYYTSELRSPQFCVSHIPATPGPTGRVDALVSKDTREIPDPLALGLKHSPSHDIPAHSRTGKRRDSQ
jgi:hypothetical protein